MIKSSSSQTATSWKEYKMATATLKKPKASESNESTNLVRFRSKHRDDKNKPGRSMRRFYEAHKQDDGGLYVIEFTPVPHEIQKALPGYCQKTFSRDAVMPDNLVDKKLAGTKLYDYLLKHPDVLSRNIFEDVSYNTRLDFGEQAVVDMQAAKEVEMKRILLEDEMIAKEARLKELEAKEKGEE